jgi:5-methylcytosine-specific restriction endonuclease McrA
MANTVRKARVCEVCDVQYRPTYHEQRTCGRYCGGILRGCAITCDVTWRTCSICQTTRSDPRRCCTPEPAQAVPLSTVECDSCGGVFTAPNRREWTYCSARCKNRASGMRRKVREAGTYGHWRWSDFMRIARRFDYRCAYCGAKPQQLDPDHVVPLNRGGPNVAANLLPACQPCNGQKTDRLLHEWADYRARRGLPAIRTTWAHDDARFHHLTAARPPGDGHLTGIH